MAGNMSDALAVAYQLVLDNRVVNQAAHDELTGSSLEPVPSTSPPTHGYIGRGREDGWRMDGGRAYICVIKFPTSHVVLFPVQ